MKLVRIQGGLGNQFFCIAFAYTVALVTGKRVVLDVGSYSDDKYGRRFALQELLDNFDCFDVVNSRNSPWIPRGVRNRLRKLGGWAMDRNPPRNERELRDFIQGADRFDGYWQNEAFILDLPAVCAKLRTFVAQHASFLESNGPVMHFRTYKEEILPWRRVTPGPEYVRAAIEAIGLRNGNLREIGLVSDDPALAEKRLDGSGAILRQISSDNPFRDLAVLIAARSLILTNSSFSWWGGVCSDASIVTYPARSGLIHYPEPSRRFTVL